jgi:hypothetical protein
MQAEDVFRRAVTVAGDVRDDRGQRPDVSVSPFRHCAADGSHCRRRDRPHGGRCDGLCPYGLELFSLPKQHRAFFENFASSELLMQLQSSF